MIVYILLAVLSTGKVSKTITADAIVFETPERCIKNLDNVKKQLETKYDEVLVACYSKEVNPGK